ncbi:hypothetical protein JY424_01050 [Stenotrophomonas maltophilia]|nr:hypothetical protein [Stenotrophomonas maltophilia]
MTDQKRWRRSMRASVGFCLSSAIIRYTAIVSTSFGAGILVAGVPALSGATVASWVQAVGSIFAIVAAIGIAYRQHAQNVDLAQRQQAQNLDLAQRQQAQNLELAERQHAQNLDLVRREQDRVRNEQLELKLEDRRKIERVLSEVLTSLKELELDKSTNTVNSGLLSRNASNADDAKTKLGGIASAADRNVSHRLGLNELLNTLTRVAASYGGNSMRTSQVVSTKAAGWIGELESALIYFGPKSSSAVLSTVSDGDN